MLVHSDQTSNDAEVRKLEHFVGCWHRILGRAPDRCDSPALGHCPLTFERSLRQCHRLPERASGRLLDQLHERSSVPPRKAWSSRGLGRAKGRPQQSGRQRGRAISQPGVFRTQSSEVSPDVHTSFFPSSVKLSDENSTGANFGIDPRDLRMRPPVRLTAFGWTQPKRFKRESSLLLDRCADRVR
jgi:hypothetical protein